ncbi:MAG: 4-hydroxy-tetrahydrodipicolinate synthase [Spirochaetia bacterium]
MFRGVYTALVTPFLDDESVDQSTLRKIVEDQIKKGVDGLVPMGTTGESPTLTPNEHLEVIRIVIDQAKKRVPVIAGTGSNSTQEAIELSQKAKELGADATLQVAPYYNKPSQEGLYLHFTAIADSVDLPLLVYNIPGRSGKNIETSTLMRMAQHTNIIGVKEASGNIPQVIDVLYRRPEGFCVLSGDDNLALPITLCGGDGVVSVASNIIPDQMKQFMNAALEGNTKKAQAEHFRLMPLFQAMFIDTNPIPVKAALALQGTLKEIYRLPMCKLSDENKDQLRNILEELKLL